MDLSRWISLVMVVLYLIVAVIVPVSVARLTDESNTQPEHNQFDGLSAGVTLLLLGFVCVWWPDVLGGTVWLGRWRGAWNFKPSTEGAVKLLGWLLLIGAVVVAVVDHFY